MVLLRHCRCSEFFRRLLAASCIALVMALGVFAASPSLHELLHHHNQTALNDGCAIALFARGVSVPLTVIAVPPAPVEWRRQSIADSTELFLVSSRYLLQPERGPPVG